MSTTLLARLSTKKTGDKQSNITNALQDLVAMFRGRCVACLREHQCERLVGVDFAVVVVEFLGAREQRHHVDDVMRGMRIELDALLRNYIVDRRAKVVAKIVYRYHPAMTGLVTHINTSSYQLCYSELGTQHL